MIAEKCERLAEDRIVTTTAAETLERVQAMNPEVAVVSLELRDMEPKTLLPKLLERQTNLFLLATYRELSVQEMERLANLGVDEFVPQPIDILQLFRAASRRFNVPFRRHDRYNLAIDVVRADGITIGRTCDVSEGGMCMTAFHPASPGESTLVDITLADNEKPLRVRCEVLSVEGTSPAPVTARIQFSRLWGPDHDRLTKFLKSQSKDLIADD